MLKLAVGRVYRAKTPRNVRGYFNDRQILHLSDSTVQYDSISVGAGRRYPVVVRAAFEAWAAEDVTDRMPKAFWEVWKTKREMARAE